MDFSIQIFEHSMSVIPVFEEEHVSSQGGDSVQYHGRITGIRGGGRLRIRLNWILIRVWTWWLNKVRVTLCSGVLQRFRLSAICANRQLWISQIVPTIERLDAVDIIPGQDIGVRVSVWVHRVHESTRICRVRQAQGVAKLMGSYHEQDETYSRITSQLQHFMSRHTLTMH